MLMDKSHHLRFAGSVEPATQVFIFQIRAQRIIAEAGRKFACLHKIATALRLTRAREDIALGRDIGAGGATAQKQQQQQQAPQSWLA